MARKLSALFMLLLLCVTAPVASAQPTNVIFFIGDGMAPAQVEAAGMFAGGPMSFESFANQGVVTTYSANSSVTDSAAAGTALATGVKVNNGVISMAYPGDGSDLQTLLEHFQGLGRSTGLVTTTYMTHATPAAFGAHEPSRNNLSQIAGDYLNQTQPNVLLGGGGNGMLPAAATGAGYTVVTDAAGLAGLDTEATTYVSGQFGSSHLPYEYDGLGALPHLSEMTTTALNILDNNAGGFFLMVEGGRIDHAGHNNDIQRNIRETVEFSNAVQEAIDWATGRTDTLIVVTADHETGGLTVLADNGAGNAPTVSWSTTGHTATNVPVYAWGVNAALISPVMDNTDFWEVMTVPEPASMGLLALASLALLKRRRR
ncbi:hypothetical protein LCGC14_0692580 [marine sediment metagenome]|uniref:Ice-binding protein C-terminal domain-containing protein n=1 Tax=marine sediment metagenome TaxID=412755 RepID=A0A0F9T6A4_9ZZZZ|nr:alkaline phosphatase [Phycisphaerae bacterium]HDZ42714.1 alkaline phosphatase [Phycisphaerae bacterium]